MIKIALQLQCVEKNILKNNSKFLICRLKQFVKTFTSGPLLKVVRPIQIERTKKKAAKAAIVTGDGSHALKDYRPPRRILVLPEAKYGGEHTVTLLTGDSVVGKQGAKYVRTILDVANVPISFERIEVSENEQYEDEYITSVLRNRNAIHIDLQHDPDRKSKNRRINNDLNLFASVVKLRCFEGFNCRFPELDMLLILQNNSGDVTKLEYEPVDGVVETLCISEEEAVLQYLDFVYSYATKQCRKKVTIPHKLSALPRTDGMFLSMAHELHQQKYPHLILDKMSVGKMSMALIECPQMFDVICAGDRYGTFLTSIASAVCGGASLFSAIELNTTHAVFKPLQTKLSITNTNNLSPYGIVRSCVDLLAHLGKRECADLLSNELLATMTERKIKTTEFGGNNRDEFVICDIVNNVRCKFA